MASFAFRFGQRGETLPKRCAVPDAALTFAERRPQEPAQQRRHRRAIGVQTLHLGRVESDRCQRRLRTLESRVEQA
jgi:hypothetical protein